MKQLVYVNFVLILLDGALLATEFIGHYEVQTLFKVCLLTMIVTMILIPDPGRCVQHQALRWSSES
jgi:hypothetical protein